MTWSGTGRRIGDKLWNEIRGWRDDADLKQGSYCTVIVQDAPATEQVKKMDDDKQPHQRSTEYHILDTTSSIVHLYCPTLFGWIWLWKSQAGDSIYMIVLPPMWPSSHEVYTQNPFDFYHARLPRPNRLDVLAQVLGHNWNAIWIFVQATVLVPFVAILPW